MKILLSLKLSSDSLMVSEALALKYTSGVENLVIITDSRYKTEIDNVKYYYLKGWQAKIPFLRVFARIPLMIRICRQEKINTIIGYHLTSYGFAGFVVSKLLKIPISIHFLGKDIDELCRVPILGGILLKFAGMADVLTVQGLRSKRYLEDKGLRNIYVLPTACDLAKFKPANSKKKFDVICVECLF